MQQQKGTIPTWEPSQSPRVFSPAELQTLEAKLRSPHSGEGKHSNVLRMSLGQAQHQSSRAITAHGSGAQPEGQPEGLSAMQHFPLQSQVLANCRKPTSTGWFFVFH